MNSDHAIDCLSALSKDHRLAAYRLLVAAGDGGIAAGRLAELLDIPASSMSFHLTQLAQAKLVEARRESRSIIYSANYATMTALVAYLTENCCKGGCCEENDAPAKSDLPSAIANKERTAP